jgi:hypothetical protein
MAIVFKVDGEEYGPLKPIDLNPGFHSIDVSMELRGANPPKRIDDVDVVLVSVLTNRC